MVPEEQERKNFDSSEYTESSASVKKDEDLDIVDYIPFIQWKKEELPLHPKWTDTEFNDEFERLIKLRATKKRKHASGAWLIGVFRGGRHMAGSAVEERSEIRRKKNISDARAQAEVSALQESSAAAGAEWLRAQHHHQQHGLRLEQPEILDADVEEQQATAPAESTLMQGVRRDIARDMMEEAA
eukprot:3675395-Lingulodinium_polyedra.AAC.1